MESDALFCATSREFSELPKKSLYLGDGRWGHRPRPQFRSNSKARPSEGWAWSGALVRLLLKCGTRSAQPMKITVIALLLAAAVSPFLYAQSNTKAQLSQEYIDILGVRVRLGMTKLDIADKLGSQKMNDGSNENFWLFGEKRPWPSSIEFKDGRVIYASESWIGSDGDVARALFGAVSSLTKQGYAACEIFSDTQTTPSLTAERVWIVCGKKSILVQRMQDSKNTYQQVFEKLGSPPSDAE